VVTLDHQGVGAFVSPEAGIKVPVINPREATTALANALWLLASSEGLRVKMGHAAWEYAKTQSWQRRAERMSQLYEGLVQS
jgi:glycosyltransferase involved in cell wall biosynthesis